MIPTTMLMEDAQIEAFTPDEDFSQMLGAQLEDDGHKVRLMVINIDFWGYEAPVYWLSTTATKQAFLDASSECRQIQQEDGNENEPLPKVHIIETREFQEHEARKVA